MQAEITEQASGNITQKLTQLSVTQPECTIYRVHRHLRRINDKAYDPEVISIGPYHHRKPNLKMLEEHKLLYFNLLLQRKKEIDNNDENAKVESYVYAVAQLEQEARKCYAEPVSLDSTEFIEMMVLDGCFVIELVRKCNMLTLREKNDPIFHMDWIMNSLQRDLMLFENQIPFSILLKLFELIELPNQQKRLMYLFFSFFSNLYPGRGYSDSSNRNPEEIKHLLHLIHSNWLPPFHVMNISQDTYPTRKRCRLVEAAEHLRHLMRSKCLPATTTASRELNVSQEDTNRTRKTWRFIKSAKGLKEANVEFQKWEKDQSLFDVRFQDGIMVLATLTVEDRTECFLRNLIAYEQYIQDSERCFVTDYAKLLDCLINTSEDVEILSRCGVVENWLGDDEVVAEVFNKLTDLVTGPGEDFIYGDIFDRVMNSHCNRRRNRWLAILRRNYLHSPWGVVSIVVALMLLIFTIIQTVCSILQVE